MESTKKYTFHRYQCPVCKIWQTGEVKVLENAQNLTYLKCCVKHCQHRIYGDEEIAEATQTTVKTAIKP